MSSGADLFVVCRHCGSEVSPYITECPYCGQRLRRRAPKLPRERASKQRSRTAASALGRLRRGRATGTAIAHRPYVTIALVLGACGLWVATSANFVSASELVILGPLHGHWWRLFTAPFVYISGVYAFVALLAIAVFGWLLERRHGPAVVIALFLGASAAGGIVAEAVYGDPLVSGGNAAALALVAAWAAPDLRSARKGEWYEGDLLGAAAIAALLLALPFAREEASWLAGVTGGVLGLLLGLGISQISSIPEL